MSPTGTMPMDGKMSIIVTTMKKGVLIGVHALAYYL
jgi:hypothetical protein